MPRQRTGAIYQDKQNRFYVRYTYMENGRRKTVRRRVVENNVTHAKKLLHKLLEEHTRKGRPSRAIDKKFADLCAWYRDTYAVEPIYASGAKVAGLRSWRSVRYRVGLLDGYFGGRAVRAITYSQIEGYKTSRLASKDAVSLTSVNRELEVLRRILKLAVREHWIERSPFSDGDGLIQKSDEPHRQYVLTYENEAALLAACDPRTARMVQFAIETGLRRGEIYLLKWSDLDMVKRRITVRKLTTKRLVERIVMMTDVAATVIQQGRDGAVFPGAQAAYKRFLVARVKAGLAHIRFHDLRHTFCTRLVEAGLPAEQAARISGHSQMSTFYRYVNVHDDRLTEAGSALDRLRILRAGSPGSDTQ